MSCAAAGERFSLAFVLFVVRYAGGLTSPRVDGKPGRGAAQAAPPTWDGPRACDPPLPETRGHFPKLRTIATSPVTTSGLLSRSGFGGMSGLLPTPAPPFTMTVFSSSSVTFFCHAALA